MSDPFRATYRPLTDAEKATLDKLKSVASDLYQIFDDVNTPNVGREIALAKTNLEQSVMWGVKAVTAPTEEDTGPELASPDEPAAESEAA